jgi:predicted transcriptional regulator
MRRRTVKSSILRLVEEVPRRYSEIERELGRPDKTIYVSLKQLLAAGLIRKDREGTYVITRQGRAAIVKEELGETAVDLVEKLGPERASVVRQWLDELLAEHASASGRSCKTLTSRALNLEYALKDDSRCKPQTIRRALSASSS